MSFVLELVYRKAIIQKNEQKYSDKKNLNSYFDLNKEDIGVMISEKI